MTGRRAPCHRLSTSCPHCGIEMIAASGVNTAKPPADGDIAICGQCRGLAVFVVGPLGTAARVPASAEAATIGRDPRVRNALGALAESYDSWTAADLAYGGGADGR